MVYQLELLNPAVETLLESLVKLKLIRLRKIEPSKAAFWKLVEELRNQNAEETLSEEEIVADIEAVRTARYA